ncbi:MAG: PQQ-dependent sugar dehydrogenase [Gammaproteobacteria bacterium]
MCIDIGWAGHHKWRSRRRATGTPYYGRQQPGYSTAIGNQLFMLEQGGNIKLYDMQTKTTTNFLNANQLGSTFVTGGETGLLGIAFDPDYAKNGYFYVNTTHRDANYNGNRIYGEVTRYTRSATDPAKPTRVRRCQ